MSITDAVSIAAGIITIIGGIASFFQRMGQQRPSAPPSYPPSSQFSTRPYAPPSSPQHSSPPPNPYASPQVYPPPYTQPVPPQSSPPPYAQPHPAHPYAPAPSQYMPPFPSQPYPQPSAVYRQPAPARSTRFQLRWILYVSAGVSSLGFLTAAYSGNPNDASVEVVGLVSFLALITIAISIGVTAARGDYANRGFVSESFIGAGVASIGGIVPALLYALIVVIPSHTDPAYNVGAIIGAFVVGPLFTGLPIVVLSLISGAITQAVRRRVARA